MKILKIICALCACALVSCGRSRDIINNDINNDNNTNVDKEPDNSEDTDDPSKEDQSLNNLEFEVISENDKTCFVKSCKEYYGDSRDSTIVIPGTYNGYKVIRVGDGAFNNCYFIQEIIISDGVEEIGDFAFKGCNYLESIFIPNTTIIIGSESFSDCTFLINITFASNSQLTAIKESTFYNCKSLTSIEIPNSVTSIGISAFHDCTSLNNVYYSGTIEDWCNISFESYVSNPMYYASHFYTLDENNEWYEVTNIEMPHTVT